MIFDAKEKKRVTNDWANLFPALQIWKPTRLLKRHGPLLIGISLDHDRSRKNYTPKAHFHTLCIPFPTMSLGLVGEVEQRGVPRRIALKRHDQEYQDIASKLRSKYTFLDKEWMEFNDFIAATANYLSGQYGRVGTFPFQHSPFEGIVSVAAYMGHTDYAQSALNDFARRISRWPDRAFNIIESAESWRAKMQALIDSSAELEGITNDQIKEHNLGNIPDYGLSWSASPKKVFRGFLWNWLHGINLGLPNSIK